ncbi:MAG: pyrroloquinoline quinone-dependent dehydrogenase [bacterium]|nr:pyrroloquinoline quinone-dependent dehydrogenase [bacterium]
MRGVATAVLPLLALALSGCAEDPSCEPATSGGPASEWPSYGNDSGGTRYSPLAQIRSENVACLEEVWRFETGDLPGARGGQTRSPFASETTPILVDETLYLCTPTNFVIAVDPATGEERWRFDPGFDLDSRYGNQLVCRGVSSWRDPAADEGATCGRRIFTATNDARLIALDASTGDPCPGFGEAGQVDLNPGVGRQDWKGEYQVTSPPAVGRDVVVVGAAIADNKRTDAPSGVVRAYDARTGTLRWAWDLRSPGFVPTTENTSEAGYALGTPNVWAPMSVDLERDLLFVPTGNPAPDYYRGDLDVDYYGSSVVAIHLASGEVAWRFQTVHHDLWDFDVPAQPTLFTLRRDGREIPALVQATKMGMLFILHRETGQPLFPVEERPVPQVRVAGEALAPTQPFTVKPAPLVRHSLSPDDAWGLTPFDRAACRDAIAALRFEGIYTPPTLEGTLMVPGNAGGQNWGGLAVDEERQRILVNQQDFPWKVALVERKDMPEDLKFSGEGYVELQPMKGTPYGMTREMITSPLGVPCSTPPWGTLASVDLSSGDIDWQVPLGGLRTLAPLPIPWDLGVPNIGGPLATGGGLVFIGAAMENRFRAFDAETGDLLWGTDTPYAPIATPMTYRVGGRQYVVIGATGYERVGLPPGDVFIAYALPDEGAP